MFKVTEKDIQAACDYAASMIAAQGRQCRIGGQCRYGISYAQKLHCAVGWLLPWGVACELDEYFLEAYSDPDYLVAEWPGYYVEHIPAIFQDADAIRVLIYLQDFHDSVFKVQREEALQELQTLGVDTKSNPAYRQWAEAGA